MRGEGIPSYLPRMVERERVRVRKIRRRRRRKRKNEKILAILFYLLLFIGLAIAGTLDYADAINGNL